MAYEREAHQARGEVRRTPGRWRTCGGSLAGGDGSKRTVYHLEETYRRAKNRQTRHRVSRSMMADAKYVVPCVKL